MRGATTRLSSASREGWGIARYIWTHPANRGRRARGLSAFGAWQVWQRVARKPWTISLGNGVRLRCYPHSTAASAAIYCRLPDWSEMNFLLAYLREGDVFVDVGANVGIYSLLAAGLDGVRVLALEPSSEAFDHLTENIDLNNATSVVAIRAAAGRSVGTLALTRGQDTRNRVVDTRSFDGATEVVDAVVLDEVVRARGRLSDVALVKIDVEGNEPEVLDGASDLLAATGPALILEPNNPGALCAVLEPLGYGFFTYDPASRSLVPANIRTTWFPNVIAVRNPKEVLARLRRPR